MRMPFCSPLHIADGLQAASEALARTPSPFASVDARPAPPRTTATRCSLSAPPQHDAICFVHRIPSSATSARCVQCRLLLDVALRDHSKLRLLPIFSGPFGSLSAVTSVCLPHLCTTWYDSTSPRTSGPSCVSSMKGRPVYRSPR